MNIYLLDREEWGYDCNSGYIIIAENEKQARKFGSKEAQGESSEIWLHEGRTNCKKIGTADKGQAAGVVLTNHISG